MIGPAGFMAAPKPAVEPFELTENRTRRLRSILKALYGSSAWEAGELLAVAARLHAHSLSNNAEGNQQ